jgi:hypothetical protein
VREEVAGLRRALLEPGTAALAPLAPRLEGAARDLVTLAGGLAAAGPLPRKDRAALTAEAVALQAELEHVARLTSQGAEFWRGWARLLGLETAPELSYTARGTESPAAVAPARSSVEG